jgi:hypothetical protein
MTSVNCNEYNRDEFDSLAETLITTDVMTVKAGEYRFLYKHGLTSDDRKLLKSKMDAYCRCRTCNDRVADICSLTDVNNKPFVFTSDYNDQRLNEISGIAARVAKTPITDVKLVTSKLLYEPYCGGFNHLTAKMDNVSKFERYPLQKVQYAVNRYVRDGLFFQLAEKVCEPGITESLELLIEILDSATYGKTWLGATRWLRDNFKPGFKKLPDHKKWEHMLGVVANATLYEDTGSQVVITYYHQANNSLLVLLETCNTKEELKKRAEEMLSPTNYQRPVAPASDNKVKIAMDMLGDFTNTYASLDDLTKYGGVRSNEYKKTSSMSGFAVQLNNTVKPKNRVVSFADRVKEYTKVSEVMDAIRNGSSVEVEVGTYEHVCCLVNTDLKREARIHDYFWYYASTGRVDLYKMKPGRNKVTGIMKLGHDNYLFAVEGSAPHSNAGNCCFPSFLTSSYSRTCRSAFEGLNKTTKIAEGVGPYAIGVGSTIKQESGALTQVLKVWVDDKKHVISHG